MGDASYYEKNKEKVRQRSMEYYYAHRDKIRAQQNARNRTPEARLAARAYQLKKKFGISLEEYDRLLAEQGGCCAICGTSKPGGHYGVFMVDHDHATNRLRGLLCHGCNAGLGNFHDNVAALLKAIEYLRGQSSGHVQVA